MHSEIRHQVSIFLWSVNCINISQLKLGVIDCNLLLGGISGIKPSFMLCAELKIQRERKGCTHIAQDMMRIKLRDRLKRQCPLSPRIQKLLINKSYHSTIYTKIISMFLSLSEVAVFISNIFNYRIDLSSLDSHQQWISHVLSCFNVLTCGTFRVIG